MTQYMPISIYANHWWECNNNTHHPFRLNKVQQHHSPPFWLEDRLFTAPGCRVAIWYCLMVSLNVLAKKWSEQIFNMGTVEQGQSRDIHLEGWEVGYGVAKGAILKGEGLQLSVLSQPITTE